MSLSAEAGAVPARLFSDRVGLIGKEEACMLGTLIGEVEEKGERVIRCNLGQPNFPCRGT